jgi:hypothetical protein
MPQPLSHRGVESNEAIREEIHPVTIAAVEIGFRRSQQGTTSAAWINPATGRRSPSDLLRRLARGIFPDRLDG